MTLLEIIEKLYKDIVDFKADFFEFVSSFKEDYDITLNESVLRFDLSSQSMDLLRHMKTNCKRIRKDLALLEQYDKNSKELSRRQQYESYLNMRDLLQTCETTFALYDRFIRKDLEPLKNIFEEFFNLTKILATNLKEHNKKYSNKLPIIDAGYPTMNKVVNLGFEITRLERITFQDFADKYPLVDSKYLKYLEFLKDPLNDRFEYQWYDSFLRYLDSFSN